MTRRRRLRNPVTSFMEEPPSVRNAIRVIVTATLATTLVGALLAWMFDRRDFPTFGDAMWWSLQTVTTVGYGDITPRQGLGRVIGAVVLLYAVAFLAVLTAAITTSFVERARRERRAHRDPDIVAVLDRLDEIAGRLERLERGGRSGPPP